MIENNHSNEMLKYLEISRIIQNSPLVLVRNKCNFRKLTEGIATLMRADHIIFMGEKVAGEQWDFIKALLLSQKTIVFACENRSREFDLLVNRWQHFIEDSGQTNIDIGGFHILDSHYLNTKTLSFAIFVKSDLEREDLTEPPPLLPPCQLSEYDINFFEGVTPSSEINSTQVGIELSRYSDHLSIKQLYYLYERDSEIYPERSSVSEIYQSKSLITWSDISTILRTQPDEIIFDRLYKTARINPEKYELALNAINFLRERQEKNGGNVGLKVPVYEDIYEAIWFHHFLENRNYLFRGQFNARWQLQSSLLRRCQNDSPLDIQTLKERLELTQKFIKELQRVGSDIFGKKLDADSVLAIAQHFGFSTPLLDYTKSFKVAAFFATLGTQKMKDEESITGVLYYIRRRNSLNDLADPGEPLGLNLFNLARIKPGEVKIIEPDIQDEDNRIKRQQGVFVADFSSYDLTRVSIDRIYFKQKKNEVFGDVRLGINEDTLLPDRTMISEIAEKVKNRFKPNRLHQGLGNTKLYEANLIGSGSSSYLYRNIDISRRFFMALSKFINIHCCIEDKQMIKTLMDDYFKNLGADVDVGYSFDEKGAKPLRPIAIVTKNLAEWSDISEKFLWNIVSKEMTDGFSEFKHYNRSDEDNKPSKTPKEKIAFACIYYLLAWEYLHQVDGDKATELIVRAFSELNADDDSQFENPLPE